MKCLNFHRFLTPTSFERVIYGASLRKKAVSGWSGEARKNGIFINLSRVEFAEFSTLAQIALLVENAARHGIKVRMALPLARARKGEKRFVEACRESRESRKERMANGVEKRILQRHRALDFMRHCGFIKAAMVSHVPAFKDLIEMDYLYGSDKSDLYEDGLVDDYEEDYTLRAMFPLTWCVPMTGKDLSRSENFMAHILRFEDLGLSELDARAVVGTVLRELIENVYQYAKEQEAGVACEPHALVGAVSLRPDKYYMRPESFRECLRDFAEWSTQTQSPIIRVIVGDSGNGIPKVLKPYFKSENEEEIPLFNERNEPLSIVEKVLFWSFNRWSTSDSHTALIKRGTRGLWLVQRLVRSYHGTITIRAEDAMVGWRYESPNVAIPVRDKNIRYMPGSFLDLCILPHFQVGERKRMIEHYTTQSETEFALVRLDGIEEGGVSEDDIKSLVKELAKATPNEHKCVIATMHIAPVSSRSVQNLLVSLIQAVCDATNPGALSLLCTGVSHSQIEAASESIDAAREHFDESHLSRLAIPKYADPVLLLDSGGKARWFGGKTAVRKVLDILIEKDEGRLDLPFIRSLASDSVALNDLYRWLRDQPDLLEVEPDDGVRLRFSVKDVNQHIINHVHDRLQDAVYTGHANAVRTGSFRTPTLQYVKRWLDVKELFKETIGIGPAAYALSRKIETACGQKIQDGVSLVRVDTSSAEITARLSKCLGIESQPYSMPGELDAFTQPEVPRVPPKTRVIVCADLILSGNTVKRAISELSRWDVYPEAVACVFDARKNRELKIFCSGREVPIVNLVELDIIIPEPQLADNIDPVLREPIHRSSHESDHTYEIPPDRLLTWCREQDGTLCFGHIERSIGRHFTTYLNAKKLIQEGSSYREEILDRFVAHVLEWIRQLRPKIKQATKEYAVPIEIWYPGAISDFAGVTASKVAEKLQKHVGIEVKDLRGIRRAACAGRWVFPQQVEPVCKNAHVFIFDWGSMTATTVQQMMRLAAEAGAISVKAVVFLSQMPIEDEMVLCRIPAIKGVKRVHVRTGGKPMQQASLPFQNSVKEAGKPEIQTKEEVIPAQVVFLSSLRMNFYPPRECPICTVRETLGNDERLCPTEFLKDHIIGTSASLKAREREEVFREAQRDLYGVPLKAEDITDLVELKQQLETALRSTEKRHAISTDLKNLEQATDQHSLVAKIAWIRLLATEAIWLKLPPLRFEELRKVVAQIALDIIMVRDKWPVDHRLKHQGIIILRAASKEDFVAEFPRILHSCIGERSLVQELFYQIFTLLRKSYHHYLPGALDRILGSLGKCHEYLLGLADDNSSYLEYIHTVSRLIQSTEFLHSRSGLKALTPRESWIMLKKRYQAPMASHHGVIGRMFDVLIPLQEASSGELPKKDDWKVALEAWGECYGFLSANVLPFLPALQKVLLGEHFAARMELDELEFLASVMEEDIPFRGSLISDLLYDFVCDPQSSTRVDKLERCKHMVERWYKFFLRAGVGEKQPGLPTARLLEFMESCPCTLKNVIKSAVRQMQRRGYSFEISNIESDELDIQIFCAKELVSETISHIIQNAAESKHADPERVKDHPCIEFGVSWSDGARDQLILRILNDGTMPIQPAGQGLRSLNAKLEAFGAQVIGKPLYRQIWSYKAEIIFVRW